MSRVELYGIYQVLYERYGPQHWWPGQGRLEIITGAILTQNTNWSNVEKAISNLKSAGVLDAEKLYRMDIESLGGLIRPAGYYNIKAKRLKNFLGWIFAQFDGNIDGPDRLDTETLRNSLLRISGVGPETADSIVLYAYDRPVFVVDAYTCRVLGRHGFIEPGTDYHEVQEFCQYSLDTDVKLYNEFHALIVKVGKEHCRKKALCGGCPLESLPHELEF